MSVEILQGDCLEVLRTLPAESVNCCVTSPPYFGLRDYGCDGQIGLEATPDDYVAKMVEVFLEVRRVLASDGTCWVNLGDSYAGSWGAQSRGSFTPGNLDGASGEDYCLSARQILSHPKRTHTGSLKNTPGLKAKDLMGIPWRVAFALQDAGWYLRSDIPWVKRASMPDSTKDRPGRALEYVFLLAKSERYHFNMDAVRAEPSGITGGACFGGPLKDEKEQQKVGASLRTQHRAATQEDRDRYAETGRQMRNGDLWFQSIKAPHGMVFLDDEIVGLDVNPRGYKGAHFATFPPDLIKPCILAGCPEGGTVLDPFVGSGTTGQGATECGCNCIGIELNEDYCRLARRRNQQGHLTFGLEHQVE